MSVFETGDHVTPESVPPLSASGRPEEEADVEELRRLGNAAVAQKDWEAALEAYVEGLSRAPEDERLLSNAAFVHLKLGNKEASLRTAQLLVEKHPDFVKGHARLVQALICLSKLAEARKALDRAKLRGSADKNLLAVAKLLGKAEADARAQSRRVFKPVFRGERRGRALYEDQPDVLSLDPEERRRGKNRQALDQIASMLSADASEAGDHLLDGLFAAMCDKSKFHATVFRGLNREQLASAPGSLRELLDIPAYRVALEEAMPRVRDKAQTVLSNVKAKAAEAGDFMDPETEAKLWPSVLQEAFARELVRVVKDVHGHLRSMMGRDPRLLADEDDPRAEWDQMSPRVLNSLFKVESTRAENSNTSAPGDDVVGTAVIDDFLGSEWMPLVKADIKRLREMGLLTDLSVPSPTAEGARTDRQKTAFRTGWLDEDMLASKDFTGLQELLQALQALPHEVNRKLASASFRDSDATDSNGRGLAARPLPGSALLVCASGEFCGRIPPGRDAGSGCLVSAMYVAAAEVAERVEMEEKVQTTEPAEAEEEVELKLQATQQPGDVEGCVVLHNVREQQERPVSLLEDRLVMWRSHSVLHERKELAPGANVDVIYFWIYRADGEMFGETPPAADSQAADEVDKESPPAEGAHQNFHDFASTPGGFLLAACGLGCGCRTGIKR
eukprot:scaffold636_cov252-Pinguiococcus_pyrenoidosus.AAC.11